MLQFHYKVVVGLNLGTVVCVRACTHMHMAGAIV